eukprot:Em0011g1056a
MKRIGQQQLSTALHERTVVTSSAQNTAHSTETRTDVCPRLDLCSDVAVKLTTPEAKLESSGLSTAVECKDTIAVLHMQSEFKRRRKVVLTGLPPTSPDEVLEELRKEHSFSLVTDVKDGSVRLLFPDATQASDCIRKLNVSKFKGYKLTASYGHPDSLLFVGNLPFDFQNTELRQLFEAFGDVLRCFVVHSARTGRNKGYAFVEYASRSQALLAKQSVAAKTVGHRGLRVDFADNGMQTPEDLQSCTLFVDRLPKSFVDSKLLRAVFSKHGTVNFCQVATDSVGCSRGFAFVDMSSSDEADRAQAESNGMVFVGQEMRVAFSMPCRPGACILQHKAPQLHAVVPTLQPTHVPVRAVTKLDPGVMSVATLAMRTAPSVLTDKTNTQLCSHDQINDIVLCGSGELKHHGDTESKTKDNHRKRPLESEEGEEPRGVYDQPYIGQHQQGIPYLHPLKRIKIE